MRATVVPASVTDGRSLASNGPETVAGAMVASHINGLKDKAFLSCSHIEMRFY